MQSNSKDVWSDIFDKWDSPMDGDTLLTRKGAKGFYCFTIPSEHKNRISGEFGVVNAKGIFTTIDNGETMHCRRTRLILTEKTIYKLALWDITSEK